MPLRPAASPPVLQLPAGLIQVAAFRLDWVRTWGTKADPLYQAEAIDKSGLAHHRPDGRTYLFAIRVHWQQRRMAIPRQRPDVENVAKLITDAFTGTLYVDDDLRFVCAVQAECFGIPDSQPELTEVWIHAVPASLLVGATMPGG